MLCRERLLVTQESPLTQDPPDVTQGVLRVDLPNTIRVEHTPTALHNVEAPCTARLFMKQEAVVPDIPVLEIIFVATAFPHIPNVVP